MNTPRRRNESQIAQYQLDASATISPEPAAPRIPGLPPIHRLIVTSWRDDHSIERLAVTRDDFDSFNTGDSIIVKVGGGLIGIPWVTEVSSH